MMSHIVLLFCMLFGTLVEEANSEFGHCKDGQWTNYTYARYCISEQSNKDWAETVNYCSGKHTAAKLPTFYNYQEWKDVYTQMDITTLTHLGYTDASNEGVWEPVVTNSPRCFEYFNALEPSSATAENCMAVYPSFNDRTTVDIPCKDFTLSDNALSICQQRWTTPPDFTYTTLSTCPFNSIPAGRYCYQRFGNATYTNAASMCPCGSKIPTMQCAEDFDTFDTAFWNVKAVTGEKTWLGLQRAGVPSDVPSWTNARLAWKWIAPVSEPVMYTRFPANDTVPTSPSGTCIYAVKQSLQWSGGTQTRTTWWGHDDTCVQTNAVTCQVNLNNVCTIPSSNTDMDTYGYFVNSIAFAGPGCNITYACDLPIARIPSTGAQSQVYTCNASLSWNRPFEACQMMCSNITVTPPLAINYTGLAPYSNMYYPNTTVGFSCSNSSFVLDGSPSVARCNADGAWNTTLSTISCKATCSIPTVTAPLTILSYVGLTATNGRILQGNTLRFQCSNTTSYYFSGQANLTCLPTASWNYAVPSCLGKCQAITPGIGLSVTYSDSTNKAVGSNVTFACTPGIVSGVTSTYCDGTTLQWHDNIPSCSLLCSSLTPTAGQLVVNDTGLALFSNQYSPLTAVKFTCNNSTYFVLDGSPSVAACQLNASWSVNVTSITCKATCNVPVMTTQLAMPSPSLASNGKVLQGTAVTFSCTDSVNYFLSGPASLTCQPNATWNAAQPVCIAKCQIPIGLTIAVTPTYSDPANHQVTSNVTFACTTATYALVGVSSTVCDATTLQWRDPAPVCLPTCASPTGLSAYVTYAGIGTGPSGRFLPNTTVTFSCNVTNYKVVGPMQATCFGNSTWDAFPTCVGTCLALSVGKDVDVAYADSTRTVNSTATLTCRDDKTLKGASSATCNSNLQWTLSPDEETSCNSDVVVDTPVVAGIKIVLQTLGCTFLIGAASAAVGIAIFLRDFSIESVLHMSEDLAIIIAHILILTVRNQKDPWQLCITISAALQYLFLTLFTVLLLEAVHSYTIATNVINLGSLLNRKVLLAVGWGTPLAFTTIAASAMYKQYSTTNGCWLNWEDNVVTFLTMGPLITFSIIIAVATEAASMYRSKMLPCVDKSQLYAARVNIGAMWLLLGGHWASWFLGSYAVYSNDVAWVAPVFASNVTLGVLIFLFHVMGSPGANKLVRKLVTKVKTRLGVTKKTDTNIVSEQ